MHRHTHTSRVLRWSGSNGVFWLQLSSHAPSDNSKMNTYTHGRCRHIAAVCIFGEQNLGLLLLKEAQMAQWVCEWEIKKRRERERSGCEWQIFPSPFSTTANMASSNTMILSSSSGKSFFSFFLSLFLSLSPCLVLSLWASREQNSFSPTAVLQPQSYWRAKVYVQVCMSVTNCATLTILLFLFLLLCHSSCHPLPLSCGHESCWKHF